MSAEYWLAAANHFEHFLASCNNRRRKYSSDPANNDLYHSYGLELYETAEEMRNHFRAWNSKHQLPNPELPGPPSPDTDLFDAAITLLNATIKDIIDLEARLSGDGNPAVHSLLHRDAKYWAIHARRRMREHLENVGGRPRHKHRGRRRRHSKGRERAPNAKGLLGKLAALGNSVREEYGRMKSELNNPTSVKPGNNAHHRDSDVVLLAGLAHAYKTWRGHRKEQQGNLRRAREEKEDAARRKDEQMKNRSMRGNGNIRVWEKNRPRRQSRNDKRETRRDEGRNQEEASLASNVQDQAATRGEAIAHDNDVSPDDRGRSREIVDDNSEVDASKARGADFGNKHSAAQSDTSSSSSTCNDAEPGTIAGSSIKSASKPRAHASQTGARTRKSQNDNTDDGDGTKSGGDSHTRGSSLSSSISTLSDSSVHRETTFQENHPSNRRPSTASSEQSFSDLDEYNSDDEAPQRPPGVSNPVPSIYEPDTDEELRKKKR